MVKKKKSSRKKWTSPRKRRVKVTSGKAVKDDMKIKVGGKTYVLLGVYGSKTQANRIKKLSTDAKSGSKAVVRKHRNGWAVYKN